MMRKKDLNKNKLEKLFRAYIFKLSSNYKKVVIKNNYCFY